MLFLSVRYVEGGKAAEWGKKAKLAETKSCLATEVKNVALAPHEGEA